jgi:hypothetical protein
MISSLSLPWPIYLAFIILVISMLALALDDTWKCSSILAINSLALDGVFGRGPHMVGPIVCFIIINATLSYQSL